MDSLAKGSLGREAPDLAVSLGGEELRGKIREGILGDWQGKWDRETKGRH